MLSPEGLAAIKARFGSSEWINYAAHDMTRLITDVEERMLLEQPRTNLPTLEKLKGLRGKSCTYGGGVDFMACEHVRAYMKKLEAGNAES